jgi:hypothetical protein
LIVLCVFSVLFPIQFDNQLRFMANEVDDVWSDLGLPSKLMVVQPAAAKFTPDLALGRRHVVA